MGGLKTQFSREKVRTEAGARGIHGPAGPVRGAAGDGQRSGWREKVGVASSCEPRGATDGVGEEEQSAVGKTKEPWKLLLLLPL